MDFQERKIRSTNSFEGEVKPSSPYHKILRHVEDPYSIKEMLLEDIQGHFWPSLCSFATRYLCWLLPGSSYEWVKND
jgi:hypothetical protein